MRNAIVCHQLLRLFHDPQLWRKRVESLLLMCTPEARYEVERHLAGVSHLWSRQLQYDHDWLIRMRKSSTDAFEFTSYATEPEYQSVYMKMSTFKMVSIRLPARGDLLSTIPFIQAVRTTKRCERWDPFTLTFKKTKTRERWDVLHVDFVPNKDFIASCRCVHTDYHVCVNGRAITDPVCFVRVGDTLQMVKNKSGKVREFRMQLD